MGVLEIKTPRLQATQQSFDLPAVSVGVDSLGLGCTRGGYREELTVI